MSQKPHEREKLPEGWWERLAELHQRRGFDTLDDFCSATPTLSPRTLDRARKFDNPDGPLTAKIFDLLRRKLKFTTREEFLAALGRPANPNAVRRDRLIYTSRIDCYAPQKLIGREEEIRLLDEAWAKVRANQSERPRVLVFVALGGEGKTSLVARWVANLAHQNWPDCDAAFAWPFRHQSTGKGAEDSSDLFLRTALAHFDETELAESAQGAAEKGKRLAQLFGERRSVLILDGIEPLQHAIDSPLRGKLMDDGLLTLLKHLATVNNGICVVTTHYPIPDLNMFLEKTVLQKTLPRLSRKDGVDLLKQLGVRGSTRKIIPFNEGTEFIDDYEKLVEDVQGHALTLNLFGSYLRNTHAGDIRRRDLVKLENADADEQGGHAFRVMDAYLHSFEQRGRSRNPRATGRRYIALLSLLGLFDRPATADCLNALWHGKPIAGLTNPLLGLHDGQRNQLLSQLEGANLLKVNRDAASGVLLSVDTHLLVREYLARRVRSRQPAAWCAAHRRLYEYLCESTREGEHPTLHDLQPLYQAVAHGCHAGLQQDACGKVYRDRIHRREEVYSVYKLGALGSDLGAATCFFEVPWSKVSDQLDLSAQVWILNETGLVLLALGRLEDAASPMQASHKLRLSKSVRQYPFIHIGRGTSFLSELEMNLGNLEGARMVVEQSLSKLGKRSDYRVQIIERAKLANILHQSGRPEAATHFAQAEAVQARNEPTRPLLRSMPGFMYCDLLLAAKERSAWKNHLAPSSGSGGRRSPSPLSPVAERATKTLEWATGEELSLFTIALDHLTLARAALYEADRNSAPHIPPSIEQAVQGLRHAGQQQLLPLALLSRAWWRFITGARTGPESAESDLEEAWEIAERGPMSLLLADIHLYRARLFYREAIYPRSRNLGNTARSPMEDLLAARKLIEKCGYWRRKIELEDAEALIGR